MARKKIVRVTTNTSQDPDCLPEERISGETFCAHIETIAKEFQQTVDRDERASSWIWISRFRDFMRNHRLGQP